MTMPRLSVLCFSLLLSLSATLPGKAHAHADADASAVSALSTLPLASIVGGASAASAGVVALPVALSVGGAMLSVKAIEVSAEGTVYVLERLSDGARVSLRVSGNLAGGMMLSLGTTVTCSVVGAGAILSVAGEVIAFVPNRLGEALMHNERLTS